MQYPVSISTGGGGLLGLFFSRSARKSKGTLEILPEQRRINIKGESRAVQNTDYQLTFEDVEGVAGLGPLIMEFHLKNGKKIQLKDVEDLAEILRVLDGHIPDKTHALVRKRIDKFEQRLGKV